jgi:hypothetical protein
MIYCDIIGLNWYYKGKDYKNEFEVNASDYNESQNISNGNSTYSITASNPM